MKLLPFYLLLALSLPVIAQSGSIKETPSPVIVDGILDDGIWQTVPPVLVNYRGGETGKKSTEPHMTVRYAWDPHYLYLAYEIFDSNLVALGTDTNQGPPENLRPGAVIFKQDGKVDVVEFFISFGDKHFMWELHHNALNQFNDLLCIVPDPEWPVSKTSMAGRYGILFNDQEWLADDGEATVAMAVKLKPKADGKPSTVNDYRDTDTGYTAEIRLPWRAIGAPKSAAPADNAAPDWNLAGKTVSLLAVTQNGDLEERYHHTSPTRSPNWFHKGQPNWPVYTFQSVAEDAASNVVSQVVADADAHSSSTASVDAAAKLGINAAMAAATFLDEQKPARSRDLYEIMILAGDSRRLNPEVLRIYQPEAYELFETPEGRIRQSQLATGLTWKTWPDSLPEAMVRVAPVPLIEWLQAQAESPTPDLAKLRQMARPLGWWLRSRNERQHGNDFRQAISALAKNPNVTRDPTTAIAILKLLADANAESALGFLMDQLASPEPERRRAAAEGLGRLAEKSDRIRKETHAPFLKIMRGESDPRVQAALAETAEAWPKDSEVGAAVMQLFDRSTDAEVRRSILFAVTNTQWPQADEFIARALRESQSGVLGAALEAAAVHPSPQLTPTILKIAAQWEEAPAQLIDALGSTDDPAAVPFLLEWLKKETNPAVRLKLLVALGRLPGDAADKALKELLARAAEPLQAEVLCHIASRRELPGASPVLAALAEDSTAPLAIRAQAVWALGNYRDSTAQKSLARLSQNPEQLFANPENASLIPESVEQARLFLDLARLRQGETALIPKIRKDYANATPATRVAMLQSLAEAKLNHPIILEGLKSGDYAIIQAAVQASLASGAPALRPSLQTLRESPQFQALANSGLDISPLKRALELALSSPSKP